MGLFGPSSGEQAAASQEAGFANTMLQTFNTQLAGQTATLGQLNTSLQNLAAGNTPFGFSPQVLATLNTQAMDTTAASFKNAQMAVSSKFAGEGGGGASALPSGVQASVFGDIAASAAGQEASELQNIQLQGFQVGRENALSQISGLETMAQLQNPEQYASQAGQGFTQAFSEQHQMGEETAQGIAAIGGLVSAGVGAATGLGGLMGGGSATTSQQGGLTVPNSLSNSSDMTMSQPIYNSPNYASSAAPDMGAGAGLNMMQTLQ